MFRPNKKAEKLFRALRLFLNHYLPLPKKAPGSPYKGSTLVKRLTRKGWGFHKKKSFRYGVTVCLVVMVIAGTIFSLLVPSQNSKLFAANGSWSFGTTADRNGTGDSNIADASDQLSLNTNWWNSSYAKRQPVTVTSTDAVASGYSVKNNVDLESLRSAGTVQNDLDDVRITAKNRSTGAETELDRDIIKGQGLNFTGSSSQYVSTGTTGLNLTDFTIEMWIKYTSTSDMYAFGISDTGSTTNRIGIRPNGVTAGKISADGWFSGSYYSLTSTTSYNDGNWHQVAFTRSGANWTLYVDGSVQAGPTSKSSTTISPSWSTIGALRSGAGPTASTYFTGQVDEVRISNTARTIPSTPQTTPYVSDSNTKALFHLDNDPYDASNNSNSGTLSASPYYTEGKVIAQQGMGAEIASNDTGLVGNWKMNNGWTDSSPSGNNATRYGGGTAFNTTSQKLGVAAGQFNGSTDYAKVDSPTGLNFGTGNFTVGLWMKETSKIASYPDLISDGSSSFGSGAFSIRYNGNAAANKFAVHWQGIGDPVVSSTHTFSAGNWYYVTLVRTGTSFKLYVNGVEEGSFTNSSALNMGKNGFRIGGNGWDGVNGFFNGSIDEVGIYSRALSTTEIQAHYNAKNEIWFKTQSAIDASSTSEATGSHSYYMYYNNAAAVSPPENKSNVYQFADDFPGSSLDTVTNWTDYNASGITTVSNGTLKLTGNSVDRWLYSKTAWAMPTAMKMKTRYYSTGQQNILGYTTTPTADPYNNAVAIATSWTVTHGFRTISAGSTSTNFSDTTVNNFNTYEIKRINSSSAKASKNGSELSHTTNIPTGSTNLFFHAYNGTVEVDWVEIRLVTANEPTSSFSAAEDFSTLYATPGVWTSEAITSTGIYGWGNLTYTNTGAGAVSLKVYEDDGETLISDDLVPGNSTGLTATSVSLSSVTTATYPTIVVKATLTGGADTPTLTALGVSYNYDTTNPSVPTNLATGTVTDTTIPLSWTASTDSEAGIQGYEVQRAPDSAGSPGSWANVASGPCSGVVATTSCDDNTASSNTKYYYKVRAKDNVGNYSSYTGFNGYNYKKEITFDTTAQGANVSTSQTNFPVAVHINSSSWPTASERTNFFGAYNTSGKRINFYDADGTTRLPYEAEYYDSGTEEAIYWVKVPQVDGNSATDKIIVGYGNDPNGSVQDQATSVWDSNYKFVAHLGNGTTLSGASSVGSFTPTVTGSALTGVSDGGANFNGSNSISYSTKPSVTNAITVSSWAKTSTTGAYSQNVSTWSAASHAAQSWALGISNTNKPMFAVNDSVDSTGTGDNVLAGNTSFNDNNWHFIAGTAMTGTNNQKVYLDGSSDGARTPTNNIINNGSNNLGIGSYGYAPENWVGGVDEVRISNTVRSADWIKLEYYSAKKTAYNGDNGAGTSKLITQAVEDTTSGSVVSATTLPETPVLNSYTSPTTDTTPQIVGVTDADLASLTIRLYDNGVLAATTTANGSGAYTFANGDYSTPLSEGAHTNLTARSVNGDDDESPDSDALSITVDVSPPSAPSTPDLASADDSGASNTDNITSSTSGITMTGTAEADSTVEIFDGVTSKGTGTATGGNYSIDISLTSGSHSLTAKATDAAGNTSTASDNLTITVDTSAPTAPSAPNLDAADDSGSSSTDNITTSTSALTLTGTAEASSTVEIFDSAVSKGTTTATGGNYSVDIDLASGTHTITAKATDTAGNTSVASASLTITVDTSAPTAPSAPNLATADDTGVSTSDNITSSTSALTLTGTAEASSTVEIFDSAVSKGTGTATGGNYSIDISLTAGSHTLTAVATDAAGNVSDSSSSLGITVDNEAAATSLLSSPASADGTNEYFKINPTITLTPTDPAPSGGDGTTYYKWNDATMTSPLTYSTPINMNTSIGQGTHTLYWKTTDTAGNVESTNSQVFKLDSNAPTITNVTSNTANGMYQAGQAIDVRVTFTEAVTVTGTPQLTLETGDTDAVVNYSSGTGSSTLVFNYTIQEGEDSLDLDYESTLALGLNGGTIKDSTAGNNATLTLPVPGATGSLGANKSLNVDTSPPEVSNVTSTSSNDSYKAGQTVNVTVNFTEAVTLSGGNLIVTLETGTTDRTVTISPFSSALTASGTYTVQSGDSSADLTANSLALSAGTLRDVALNDAILSIPAGQNIANLKNILIDTVAPTTTLVSNPVAANGSNSYYTTSPVITLSSSDPSPSGGAGTIYYKWNDALMASPSTYSSTIDMDLSIGQGTHTLYYRTIDAAGNQETIRSRQFKLDTAMPNTLSVSIAGGSSYGTTNPVTLTISAADTTSGIYQMQFSNDGVTYSSWQAYATSKSWDIQDVLYGGSSDEGSKTVYVRFKDNAGNISSAVSDTITLDTVNPVNPTAVGRVSVSDSTAITTNNWYKHTTPRFTLTGASDATAGIDGYWVYWGNSSTASPLDGDYQTSTAFNPTILSEDSGKTFYLRVRAKDRAGNLYTNASSTAYTAFVYKFDVTNPDPIEYITPDPAGWSSTDSFNFTWPVASDNLANGLSSGVGGYQYKRQPHSTWTTVDTNAVTGVTSYQAGVNMLQIRTVDRAGNVSADLTVNYYYSGNVAGPENLAADLSRSEAQTVNNFKFTWDAPEGVTPQGYYYSVNSVPNTLNTTYVTTDYTDFGPFATQQGLNTFYVVTKDENGNIGWSNYAEISFTCDTSAPGIPTAVMITDSSSRDSERWQLTVNWDEPADVTSDFDGYVIERSTDGSNYTQVATTSADTTGYLDTNLDNETTYYYRIKTRDNTGNVSSTSSVVTEVPTGRYTIAPEIIGSPSFSVKTTKAEVSWTTEREADSFVQVGTSSSYGMTQGQLESTKTHKVSLSGLTPGTIYHFRAMWRDSDGNIGYSNDSIFKTTDAPAISEVKVTDIGLDSAVVTWQTNTVSSSTINYGETSSYGNTVKDDSTSGTTVHTVKLSGLTEGTAYNFKIGGTDTEGNTLTSDNYSFQTLPKPKISNVQYDQIKTSAIPTVDVKWETNVPTSSVVEIYEGSSVVAKETSKALLEEKHSISVTNLNDDTNYRMIVKGRDQYGNEAETEAIDLKTALDSRPPTIFNTTVETNLIGLGADAKGQLVISWETDEPSTSQVIYGLGSSGSEYSNRTQEDTALTSQHIVIISDLKPSTSYHFSVISKDRALNQTRSVDTAVLTDQATESVVDVVVKSLQMSIGWIFGSIFGGVE